MSRASISLTKPNEEWIVSMLEREEYSSKTELINDLVRRAREAEARNDWLRREIQKGLDSGVSDITPEQLKGRAEQLLKDRGLL